MKKKMFQFGALGGVLMVLILLYVFFGMKKDGSKDEEAPDNRVFPVAVIDVNQINRMILKNDSGELALVKTEGGFWTRLGADIYPVNQDQVENLVEGVLSNLNAYSEIKEPGALSEYGLDIPKEVLMVYQGDESLITIYLGDKVPNRDAYYCRFGEQNNVYTVPVNYHRFLSLSWDDLTEKLNTPEIASVDDIREITVESSIYGEFHAVYDEKNPYDYSDSSLFSWYFTEPVMGTVNADLNTVTWYDHLSVYRSVPYERPVGFRPVSLSEYGLDQPTTVLTLKTEESGEQKTYVLKLGKSDDAGNVYGAFDGSDWVFLFSESTIEKRCKLSVYSYAYLKPFWPNTHLMNTLKITAGDVSYELSITHGEETDTATWNGKDVTEILGDIGSDLLLLKYAMYVNNGIRADLGLTEEGAIEANEKLLAEQFGPAVLVLEAMMQEPLSDTRVSIFPYDENYDIVCVNGNVNFLIDIRDVESYLSIIGYY